MMNTLDIDSSININGETGVVGEAMQDSVGDQSVLGDGGFDSFRCRFVANNSSE